MEGGRGERETERQRERERERERDRETNFFQLGGAESSTDKTSAEEESLTSLCCGSFSICVVESVSAATTTTITLFSD
jgi:hypothetical protein